MDKQQVIDAVKERLDRLEIIVVDPELASAAIVAMFLADRQTFWPVWLGILERGFADEAARMTPPDHEPLFAAAGMLQSFIKQVLRQLGGSAKLKEATIGLIFSDMPKSVFWQGNAGNSPPSMKVQRAAGNTIRDIFRQRSRLN